MSLLTSEIRSVAFHRSATSVITGLCLFFAFSFQALGKDVKDTSDFSYSVIAPMSYTSGGDLEGGFLRTELALNYLNKLNSSMFIGFDVRGEWQRTLFENGKGKIQDEDPRFWVGIGFVSLVGIGDVVIGRTPGAVSQLTYSAPSALGGAYGVNFPHLIAADPLGFAPFSPTASPTFYERATKLAFYTPNSLGLRLGVSYAPDDDEPDSVLAHDLDNALEVALAYKTNIGVASLNMSTGIYRAKPALPDNFDPQFYETTTSWASGFNLNLGGWTVGGSYLVSDNVQGFRDISFDSYTSGVTWRSGRIIIGASHGEARTKLPDLNRINGAFGDRKTRLSEVGMTYDICPASFCSGSVGLDLGVGWVNLKRRDSSFGTDLDQNVNYGVVQTTVTF